MTALEEQVTGEVTGRLFESAVAAMEMACVYLGVRLGLYDALATPRTASGLAQTAGIDERYAREWLEQQAISGLVTVVTPGDGSTRVYGLSPDQAASLGDQESPLYAGSMALLLGGLGVALPLLPDVYRSGAGIPFGAYGDDVRIGQGMFNKGAYLGQLTQEWLPGLGDVSGLLVRPGAVALDLGCGVGWSSVALARAYPGLRVLGLDSDDASVMDARTHAVEAGVAGRVDFEVSSADRLPEGTQADVALFLESLHDMAHPVASLRAVRGALRPGGAVVVVDERAEEEFAPDGSPVERLLASASVLHCLPVGRSEPGSAATGALLRPATLRAYAAEAGFTSVEVAPIEHDVFRFYVLRD
jgi:2-polyprenyl-3-methyl-5-hydroxy-6-metoxy-1,4-benzoquinol methylase